MKRWRNTFRRRIKRSSLDGAKAGTVLDGLGVGVGARGGDVLAAEAGEDARVGAVEGARAAEAVDLAGVAERARAGGVGAGVGAGEELAGGGVGVERGLDVLEDVALGDGLAARVDLEGVAGVVVPVVVDGVEEGVAGDLGGAAGGVEDVVVLEGDELRRFVSKVGSFT